MLHFVSLAETGMVMGRGVIDQWSKFRIFNSLTSNVIIINDVMALILSAPPTSTEIRLDQTPYNNDTKLSNGESN